MIPGVCPVCGFAADLDAFLVAGDFNRALAAALDLPAALAGRILAYLRLFSPASKKLAAKKVARLLTELSALVKAAEVERHGEARRAPRVLWEQALDEILTNPPDRLPLENHNYLIATVHRLAGAAAGRQAQRAEDRRHQGTEAPRRGELQPLARVVDRAAGKAGAASLRGALGRRPVSNPPGGEPGGD